MSNKNLKTVDLVPKAADFLGDVVKGLSAAPKSLSPKYCYDEVGSGFFDEICRAPEYYLTRVETAILDQLGTVSLPSLASDKPIAVVELGGATSDKFRRLLPHVANVKMYMPVDISRDVLFGDAAKLAADHPNLNVVAVCADYQQLANFPWQEHLSGKTPLLFFPGSTIGNLSEEDTTALMRICQAIVGDSGFMLLGCDLMKPVEVIVPAYSDAGGANARFNLNVLHRINRELGGDIKPENFRHDVQFNHAKKQIDIHLVSKVAQDVHLAGQTFHFKEGEGIYAESSRKFDRIDIEKLTAAHGRKPVTWWTDPKEYYALVLLKAVP